MVKKIVFKLGESLKVGTHIISCDYNIFQQKNFTFEPGISKDSKVDKLIKTIFWPLYDLRNFFLVDGFIKKEVGKLIKKYLKDDTTFLDAGCGDMGLRRFLPKNVCYNGFDIRFSEFHLGRVLSEKESRNIALFSALKIPLDPNTASLVVSTQVIGQIRDVDKVVSEIHRILKPNGILILSIPNGYCYKFERKGPHPACTDNWTFDEFKEFMKRYDFKYLEGYMKGYWIPLPLWFTNISYQLPISCKEEKYNTDFFFVFQK